MQMVFDENFIRRVYRTTVWVWAVMVVWSFGLGQPFGALGLTLGTLVGMASLRSLEVVVKRSLTPSGEPGHGFPMVKYAFVKYPAYLLVLGSIVLTRNTPIIVGFVVGLGLVHVVIILKAVGRLLLQHVGKQ